MDLSMDADEIRARLTALRTHDLPTHGGRTLAYVYDSGLADADALGREALAMFGSSNGLDPTAFPSLLAMEQDLVAQAGELLQAPSGFAGVATSGGTESILLAVLAARDAHPDVTTPRMVLPTTAHAAFHKAAHYFRVEPVLIDVDPESKRADPDAMTAAIDERTVLVVASAPSYAHGVIDPVGPIAAAAAQAGVRCHVDACIGGWVLPFLRDDEPDQPPWTFAVEGVTSISVDLHKYGYTPKGVSLLLHRSADLRRSHFFASASWPGYTMLNTTMQSTKSGGPLAAARAVVNHIGRDGYRALARRAREATLAIATEVNGIPALSLAAQPDSTLVSVTTDETCDVFTISDELLARGWYTQPQLAFGDLPATLHLSVSAATADLLDELSGDLQAATDAAVAAGPVASGEELVVAASSVDPAHLDGETIGVCSRWPGWQVTTGPWSCPSGWRRSTRCSTPCPRSCARRCSSECSTG
ncbi:MAG: aminotransferase class V-fold PLP-dependent enzyme [Intrasporangium sp.]|uniref:pyridoxal phosphate-dependent decarboxylase family protein n=1 Tax=Intrasporangium sp. TaxID=1925024 RepID=UPI00264A21FE|nr:aminotransferase class V-fold PLP-dependent enzyme [Intrasporangium sp.]MDN5797536.1 aminotransferase class V-fold PLP-dependent enzyme [Intrasporangium sp.]